VALQNLTLALHPIFPTQSSDSKMIGSAVKVPTLVRMSWVVSPPNGPSSLWQMMLEISSSGRRLPSDTTQTVRTTIPSDTLHEMMHAVARLHRAKRAIKLPMEDIWSAPDRLSELYKVMAENVPQVLAYAEVSRVKGSLRLVMVTGNPGVISY
jgi:hypothetical protein